MSARPRTDSRLRDYADIQQLYWRYNHGADFRDADLFVSAFADDVVFRTGGLELTGKDELTAWRGERDAGETGDNGRRHAMLGDVTANSLVHVAVAMWEVVQG